MYVGVVGVLVSIFIVAAGDLSSTSVDVLVEDLEGVHVQEILRCY